MAAPRERQKLSPPIHLKFSNLTVKVDDKYILQDITGEVKPGEILAIMGPSGAGKSTLLNMLSGHNKGMALERGQILINNQRATKVLRRQIGYVVQDDSFLSHLTVKQSLQFVGELLIPDTMTSSEKAKIVESVVDELGLRKCLDTVMGGGMFETGCSGGEKKRCSIAVEMIKNPGMLILDEPTSGLDAAIACSLIKSIKNLAEKDNRAIITSIHQPSSHVFHMFDKLLLLCNGKVAYYGRTSRVLDFFKDLNMACYSNWNPADYILEKLTEGIEVEDKIIKKYKEVGSFEYQSCNTRVKVTKTENLDDKNKVDDIQCIQINGVDDPRIKVLSYDNVSFSGNGIDTCITEGEKQNVILAAADVEKDIFETADDSDFEKEEKWPTGFQTQFTALCRRAFIQNNKLLVNRFGLGQSIGIALVASLIWFNTPYDETSIVDRHGLIFFITMYLTLEPLFFTILSFPAERETIAKERRAGMYRLSSYFVAKMVSEFPVLVLQPSIIYTLVYWATGMNRSPVFLIGFLLIITECLLAQSIGYCASALMKNMRMALSICVVFSLAMMLLGGFFSQRMHFWIKWGGYISFISHGFNIQQRLEFSFAEEKFLCAKDSVFDQCKSNSTTWITGEEILMKYSVLDCTIGESFLVLWGCIFFCRGLFYVILRFVNRPQ